MKSFLLIFSIFFISANVCFSQNPIAEFRFNGGALYDETGNGNSLSSLTDVIPAANAQNEDNRAVQINQNYLFNDNADVLNMTTGITVSGWFYLSDFNGEWTALINKWAGEPGSYYLGINSANRRVRWNCSYGDIEDFVSIPLETWVHYAATYDGQELKLYRDGSLVNSLVAPGDLLSNELPFAIGGQSNLPALNYNGFADEIFVYDTALDDDAILELYGNTYTSLNKDLVFLSMGLEQIQESTNPNNNLAASIFNNGLEVITDFSINLTSSSFNSEVDFNNLSIQPYETFIINDPFALAIDVGQEISVDAELTNINGGQDDVSSNNFKSDMVRGLFFIPQRKVVIEEGTGTWCGWCPRGAVALDQLEEAYPDRFIGIAVHNGDPMTVAEYDDEIGFTGFPTCHVDRTLLNVGISPTAAEVYVNDRLSINNTPSLGVSQTLAYDPSTRMLEIESNVLPALPLDGDYRMSFVILEDEVTGTTTDYDQVNFYANNSNGVMGGYELLGNPVPAADMVYDHVARAVIGGVRGAQGSLPQSMTHGEIYSYQTSFEIPAEFNEDNLYVVALVLDATTGEIMNAEKKSLMDTSVSVEDIVEDYELSMFPNPTQNNSQLFMSLNKPTEVVLGLFDAQGKLVERRPYGKLNGDQVINIQTQENKSGMYFIHIQLGDKLVVKKLIVKK